MKSTSRGFTLVELIVSVVIISIVLSICFAGGGTVYGYANSKDVSGKLIAVTSAMPAGAFVNPTNGASVFQAGVTIRSGDGVYTTFSTEDRQWASLTGDKITSSGKCVTARIFPYAPWELGKAGTYHNGRLLALKDC